MFFRLFAIAVFGIMFGLLSAAPAHADDFASQFKIPATPRPAPALTFNDGDGISHDLKEFKGRYVLLNLWASWCGPCVHEMPSLAKLKSLLDEKKIAFIALNEDRDGVDVAQAFYKRHSITNMKVFVDNSGRAPYVLHTPGLPITILFDPQSMEIGRVEGEADWATPDAVAFLKKKISD